MISFALVCKVVATHLVKKAVGKAVGKALPAPVKKASKVYSAAKIVKTVSKHI